MCIRDRDDGTARVSFYLDDDDDAEAILKEVDEGLSELRQYVEIGEGTIDVYKRQDAIHSDENGKADIDYDKCVSCGMCLVNCPFGAIADKSQIFQVIRAIQTLSLIHI